MPLEGPYLRALGERADRLHPALRTYFSGVPQGSVGIGDGVFDRVGTSRRWLWPFLALFSRPGVVVACDERAVPFTVRNTTVDGAAHGRRELRLRRRTWTMTDAVSFSRPGRVVDRLGRGGNVAVSFEVRVESGALVLASRAVGVRLGPFAVKAPQRFAPRIRLHESWDDAQERQRVELTVDVPGIGRVYEYSGTFAYRIEESA